MKLNQPLIISLLFHICLYLLALLNPGESLLKQSLQPVEIVYQDQTKRRQIVIDPNEQRLMDSLKKLKEQADRLSRITQRVKEQTIASQVGKTQNQTPQKPSTTQNTWSQEAQKEPEDLDSSAPSITKPIPSVNSPVGRNAQTGDSSIAEYIPEVRRGGFTALNTDQFLHYTFYARINEQIRSRWVASISQFLETTPQSEINRLALKVQRSQVEILLDSKGHFVKALVHQRSENSRVDESAIMAFRLASPLNNPPSEMIEPDGFIHLHYGFYVQFRPQHMASGTR